MMHSPPKQKAKIVIPPVIIRILLACVGLIVYFTLAFFASIIAIMFYVGNSLDAYVWRYSNARYFETMQKWSRRTNYMLWVGAWRSVKFIFTGGDTDLLREFWHQTHEPLVEFAGHVWDDSLPKRG